MIANRFGDLAQLLEAVASSTRLELLHQLRAPHILSDIRVTPTLSRGGERPERPLARQTVAHHLEQLVEHGLVQRVPAPDGRGEAYLLDHARLFALVDELRSLAKLRPILPAAGNDAETVAKDVPAAPRLPSPPRFLVAYGREDGAAFPVAAGEPGGARIGRSPGCAVVLDHDPYVSSEHAVVARTEDGFTLTDLASRNGTWIDWERLRPNRPAPLRSGQLVTVGRSVLVFQA